ncbi:MAG: dephospho-CoA kinase [SAR86 cluster bacterium]|nr:dephospho-CoA kinase [SAR86 cluster bacterium]
MFVVGLTGGIGSGKTAASEEFKKLGVDIVDADQASREVVKPGMPSLLEIKSHFGSEILQDGFLNRAKLREIIFANSVEKKWLEELLHPRINSFLSSALKDSHSEYSILVSPLLLETNQLEYCSRILIIDSEEEKQIKRTVLRDNVSKDQVVSIMGSQMTRNQRLAKADDVLFNNGDLKELKIKVREFHEIYLKLCQ